MRVCVCHMFLLIFGCVFVSQAILCTKETNEKCRNLSYQLLKDLGYATQRCYGTTPEGTDSFTVYLHVFFVVFCHSTTSLIDIHTQTQ